jgi:hypothetical protein
MKRCRCRGYATRRRYYIAGGIAAILVAAFGLFQLGRAMRTGPGKAPENTPTAVSAPEPAIVLPAPPVDATPTLDSASEAAVLATCLIPRYSARIDESRLPWTGYRDRGPN